MHDLSEQSDAFETFENKKRPVEYQQAKVSQIVFQGLFYQRITFDVAVAPLNNLVESHLYIQVGWSSELSASLTVVQLNVSHTINTFQSTLHGGYTTTSGHARKLQ